MQLLAFLHEPHHLLSGVADLLGGPAEVQQAAQRRRVEALGRRPQDPELEPFAHLVEPVLEVRHLRGQPGVAQHQRRVCKADRDLGDVLHLDEHVDGAVEVVRGLLGRLRRRPWRGAGEGPQLGDAG